MYIDNTHTYMYTSIPRKLTSQTQVFRESQALSAKVDQGQRRSASNADAATYNSFQSVRSQVFNLETWAQTLELSMSKETLLRLRQAMVLGSETLTSKC